MEMQKSSAARACILALVIVAGIIFASCDLYSTPGNTTETSVPDHIDTSDISEPSDPLIPSQIDSPQDEALDDAETSSRVGYGGVFGSSNVVILPPLEITEPEPLPDPDVALMDENGAVAMVNYFIDLYAYMAHTGNTIPFQNIIFLDTCTLICMEIPATIALYSSPVTVTGGNWTAEILQVKEQIDRNNNSRLDFWVVDAHVHRDPMTFKSDNEPDFTTGEIEADWRFILANNHSGWLILDVVETDWPNV